MKKHILIINDEIIGGGVEKVMLDLSTFLCGSGYSVTISTIRGDKNIFYQYYSKRIQYVPLYYSWVPRKRYSVGWFVQVAKYFAHNIYMRLHRNKLFDIVIAMKEGKCMQYAIEYRTKKRFAWVHVDYSYMHWTRSLFSSSLQELNCFKAFDKVICVSNAAADGVVKTIGNPGNLCVRYNPINYAEIRKKSTLPIDIKKQTGKLLFVPLGRLDSVKQYDLLIDVCKELEQKYNFELWIIGEGKQRPVLEEKITYSHCIRLLGEKENPYPYLKLADCFVSSSKVESYGIAIQESLVLRVPVIALSCPAIEETLDIKFGKIVQNNKMSLKSATEYVLQHPDVLKKYQYDIDRYYNVGSLWIPRLNAISRLWK